MTTSMLDASDIQLGNDHPLLTMAVILGIVMVVVTAFSFAHTRRNAIRYSTGLVAVACLALSVPAGNLDTDNRESRERHNAKVIGKAFPELPTDVSRCVEKVAESTGRLCWAKVIEGDQAVELKFENVEGNIVYFEKDARRIGGLA